MTESWAQVEGAYRYTLGRRWGVGGLVMFLGHNPSTAVADADDSTSLRFASFAKAWGFGGYVACNPFALIATDKRELRAHADPVGPLNLVTINDTAMRSNEIVVCCGAIHPKLAAHVRRVLALLAHFPLYGLGEPDAHSCLLTADGFPLHPLYKPARYVMRRFYPVAP